MAKESGLGLSCTVDDSAGTGRDISNDITGGITISTPSGVQDVTGLDKSAMERLLLLADAVITLNGTFNDAANMSHAVFKDYRTILAGQVGRTVAFAHSGQTLSLELVFTDYQLNRAADGSLTWTAPGQLADGTVPTWS
jgi:hypothetical protein